MASVVIQSPKIIHQAPTIKPVQNETTLKGKEIDNSLNAQTRKAIGEKAFNEAINNLKESLSSKNISVSSVVDVARGLSQIQITDNTTGKAIIKIPNEVAVDISEKARQKQIGFLIDHKL